MSQPSLHLPKPHLQTLPKQAAPKGCQPIQDGQVPFCFSPSLGKIHAHNPPQILHSWGGIPYSLHPPQGWVQVTYCQDRDVSRQPYNRPLLDKDTPLQACGDPIRASTSPLQVTYALFAPPEKVHPLPTNPTRITDTNPQHVPTLGAIHDGHYYYVSKQEPWSEDIWHQYGYCRMSPTQWAEPLNGAFSWNKPLHKLPAINGCLDESGTTPNGYFSNGEVHLTSLVLDRPDVAAKFFGQPLLARLPKKTTLKRPLVIHNPIQVPLKVEPFCLQQNIP